MFLGGSSRNVRQPEFRFRRSLFHPTRSNRIGTLGHYGAANQQDVRQGRQKPGDLDPRHGKHQQRTAKNASGTAKWWNSNAKAQKTATFRSHSCPALFMHVKRCVQKGASQDKKRRGKEKVVHRATFCWLTHPNRRGGHPGTLLQLLLVMQKRKQTTF